MPRCTGHPESCATLGLVGQFARRPEHHSAKKDMLLHHLDKKKARRPKMTTRPRDFRDLSSLFKG